MTHIDGPTSPLGFREYRELWSANAASNFGSQIQVVGAAWLMASLTTSPQLIAFVQTAINLPTVFFILAGGAMADSYDRRRIMLVCQISMLMTALVLALLSWQNAVTPVLLLALTFTISAFGSFSNPSWQASVRDILPRAMISRAVALNSMSINLARTAGPALGGAIVIAGGVATAFVANAISFIGFVLALLRWKPQRKPRTSPRERLFPAMAAGVRYAAMEPHVRNAVIRGGLSGLSASAVFALLPVLARQEMAGNALTYGLLLAAFGGGAVISAFVGGRLRSWMTPDQVIRISTVSLVVGLGILGWAPNVWVAGIGAALGGSGWTMTHSTYNTTVQLSASQWVTARSLALYQTATFAGMAAGSGVFGWVAEHQGIATAFFAASGAQAVAGVIGLFLPLPRLQDLKVDPLELWHAPELNEAVGADEGPIRVEIEYQIPRQKWEAFLAAMEIRARIRKRDGAKNWALWQDVSDRTRWIESYRVVDWAEYLRHNNRRTEADRENYDALHTLNASPDGSRIKRYLGKAD